MVEAMLPMDLLKHELGVRQQVISDLQAERTRMFETLERVKGICNRLQDEVMMVTVQTTGIVKVLMLMQDTLQTTVPGHMLKKARFYVLEKGAREGLADGDLSFELRAMTDDERKKEDALQNKATEAETRILKAK